MPGLRERLSQAHARGLATLRQHFRGDLLAGITVMVVLVPQALAYAVLAGVPPVYGLYAATIPPLVYALVGSSRFMAIGPVALTSLMIASGLEGLAEPGTEQWAELAVLLSFEVGVLFVLFGLVRAGFLVNFLGYPTILGFNAAAGLITAGSQLRPFFGIPREIAPGLPATKPWPILLHLDAVHLPTLAVASGSLVALVSMRRYAPRWPNYLLVCVVGIVLAWALDLPAHGVAVVGEIPRGLPRPQLPSFELDTMRALLPAAASILVIGYVSSITVVKALEAKARGTVEPGRELFAFGLANLASGVFGSFPVSSGLARATVTAQAGARTRLTGVIAALGVLAALILAGALFEWLPRPVLASIVMLAASSLIDVGGVREVFKTKRADGVTSVLTFIATLVIGLEVGLAVGIVAALVFFVARTTQPHTAELGRVPGTTVYRNIERVEAAEVCPQVSMLRIDAPLYYANARFLDDRITSLLAEREPMKLLALDFAAVNDVDATAVLSLHRLIEALRAGGNDLHIIGAIGPVRDLFARSGLLELLGEDHMHRNFAEAAAKLSAAVDRSYCEGTCRAFAFPSCTLIPRAALVRDRAKAARFTPQI
ncbi:putative sulfate transporter [Enhygromyxa salina]|uniref:Putative sulfate transporter n=1 Tax=Enhygromyxa salina TaxID=215803 RepID=A0A2S9XG39_9BACT|nr:sulfate permease [Enhygromyxa salina]PRP91823.1 putative sulfate transporter [Enhygromyxa salina]